MCPAMRVTILFIFNSLLCKFHFNHNVSLKQHIDILLYVNITSTIKKLRKFSFQSQCMIKKCVDVVFNGNRTYVIQTLYITLLHFSGGLNL